MIIFLVHLWDCWEGRVDDICFFAVGRFIRGFFPFITLGASIGDIWGPTSSPVIQRLL
jgi:hypothetical protein